MNAFHGASKQKMDDRGRVHLPVRWGEAIKEAGELVLTAGPEGSLLLAKHGAWEKTVGEIGDGLLIHPDRRRLRSLFVGHAEIVSPDKSNRVLINEPLRDWADLGDLGAVMLVGAWHSIEIWSPKRWREQIAAAMGDRQLFDLRNTPGDSTDGPLPDAIPTT